MDNPEKLDALFNQFAGGLKVDVTPTDQIEFVTVKFDDGTIGEVPASELVKIG